MWFQSCSSLQLWCEDDEDVSDRVTVDPYVLRRIMSKSEGSTQGCSTATWTAASSFPPLRTDLGGSTEAVAPCASCRFCAAPRRRCVSEPQARAPVLT